MAAARSPSLPNAPMSRCWPSARRSRWASIRHRERNGWAPRRPMLPRQPRSRRSARSSKQPAAQRAPACAAFRPPALRRSGRFWRRCCGRARSRRRRRDARSGSSEPLPAWRRPSVGSKPNSCAAWRRWPKRPAPRSCGCRRGGRSISARATLPPLRETVDAARSIGLIVDSHDPLLRIEACPGAPDCKSSSVDARGDARRLAALASAQGYDGSIHVSGCAKGCARSAPSKLVLVGKAGRYRLVRNATTRGPVERIIGSG